MTDAQSQLNIIEQLREHGWSAAARAADRIEELEKALKPLANLYWMIEDDKGADDAVFFQHDGCILTYGDIRAARNALAGTFTVLPR